MIVRHIRLINENNAELATADVTDEGDHFGGSIDLRSTPADLCKLFHEFEEIVNGQMFVFLDEIQDKISAVPIKVIFDDGEVVSVKDLQVFPSTHNVSFRLADVLCQQN